MANSQLVQNVSFTGSLQGGRHRAIPEVVNRFGSQLLAVPQGEDERPAWILEILGRIWQLLDMEALQGSGTYRTYTDVPRYHYNGQEFAIPPHLLGIFDELMAAADVMTNLHSSTVWSRPLQAGFMSPYDLAVFSGLSPQQTERFRPAFDNAIVNEVWRTFREIGNQMVVWLESPASLVGLHAVANDGGNVAEAAEQTAQDFRRVIEKLPSGLTVYIHLCRGDLGHKSWFGSIDGLTPMVVLANAIYARFPHEHSVLGGIHLPVCAGDVLPSTSDGFFDPLASLGADIPVIFGGVHEVVGLEHMPRNKALSLNLRSLYAATAARGVPFKGISFSCGAGRMSRQQFEAGLDMLSGMVQQAGA